MQRATKKEFRAYGIYNLTMTLAIMVEMSYFTIFLTDNIGLSAALAGTCLVVARIVDFIAGIVSGGVIQSQAAKGRMNSFWMSLTKFTLIVGVILSFTNTSSLAIPVRFVIAAIAYILVNCSMDFVQPAMFGAIGDICGPIMEDRQKMAIMGTQALLIAQFFCSLTAINIINWLTPYVGQSNGYLIVATVYAIPFFFAASNMKKVLAPYEAKKKVAAGGPKVGLGEMIKGVASNSQLLVFVLAYSIFIMGFYVLMTVMAYYFLYVAGSLALMSVAMSVSVVVSFLASLAAPKVAGKVGKKMTFVIGCVIAALGFIIIGFSKSSTTMFIVGNSVFNFGYFLFFGFAANFAQDVGEYGLWKTGKDNRALALGILNMPMKIGMIVGGAIGSFGLASIGYVAGMKITPEFLSKFMVLTGYVPAALIIVSAIIILFGYKISDADAAKYAKENAEKIAASH